VLKELADLENPMRSAFGTQPGDGATLEDGTMAQVQSPSRQERSPAGYDGVSIQDLVPPAGPPSQSPEAPPRARPEPRRFKALPTLQPDPAPDGVRSRFDADEGVVYYNDRHPDYLLLKSDEPALLDYLATLVAKEYVVYNNPRAPSEELAEEMVRMLVRVRRHLPRR
jgi:hypothetical protein